MSARVRRWRARQARVRRNVEYGLAEGPQPVWFLTVTQGHCLDSGLRAAVWHRFLTLLQKHYPDVAACTSVEWAKSKSGVHLHAIVCGAPDFSQAWAARTVGRILPGARCHCKAAGATADDRHALAWYVTKQFDKPDIMSDWPPFFRPFTKTTNWPVPDDVPKRRSPGAKRRQTVEE